MKRTACVNGIYWAVAYEWDWDGIVIDSISVELDESDTNLLDALQRDIVIKIRGKIEEMDREDAA